MCEETDVTIKIRAFDKSRMKPKTASAKPADVPSHTNSSYNNRSSTAHSSDQTDTVTEFRRMYIYKELGTKAIVFIEDKLNEGNTIPQAFDLLKQRKRGSYDNAVERLKQHQPGKAMFDFPKKQSVEEVIDGLHKIHTFCYDSPTHAPKPLKEVKLQEIKHKQSESSQNDGTTPSRHGKRWTEEEDNQLKELYEYGFGVKDITKFIPRTPVSILFRLSMMFGDNWSTDDTSLNEKGYREIKK